MAIFGGIAGKIAGGASKIKPRRKAAAAKPGLGIKPMGRARATAVNKGQMGAKMGGGPGRMAPGSVKRSAKPTKMKPMRKPRGY